jgi:hypothetical protein
MLNYRFKKVERRRAMISKIALHKKNVIFLVIFFLAITSTNAFSETVILGKIKKVYYNNRQIEIQTNSDVDMFNILPSTKFYIKSNAHPATLEGLREDELLLPGIKVKLIVINENILEMFVLEVPE